VHVGQTGPHGDCATFFEALDRQTIQSDAVDAGYGRVARHPYLRTNRFLASFGQKKMGALAFAAWIDHLQALDQRARRSEINNLSDSDVAAMARFQSRNELIDNVTTCGNLLRESDFSDAEDHGLLDHEVSVQDAYIPLRRILGLYPFSSWFVSRGVGQWHSEARERFSHAAATDWQSIRYTLNGKADPAAARRIVKQARRDALGIPAYDQTERDRLFHAHAPQWEVETLGDDDRIGAPVWRSDGRIAIDIDLPTAYTYLSFARYDGSILTQLNYIIWLPSRPKTGVWDIYGGLLDGITYRVTLDDAGRPILFETMHNCGCYYKAYPTDRLVVRDPIDYAEPPLIFKAPALNPSTESMVVAMETGTHYVNHLYPLPRSAHGNSVAYRLADYDALKQLPRADGRRKSMFDRHGLVPGTQRLERYILWPTGVLSPGAMRQWGTHAVAFVGRRHFDDPFYLQKMFYLDNPEGTDEQ
jgi:hypothetical protein